MDSRPIVFCMVLKFASMPHANYEFVQYDMVGIWFSVVAHYKGLGILLVPVMLPHGWSFVQIETMSSI